MRDAIAVYRNLPPGALYIIPVRFSPCQIPDLRIDSTLTLPDLQYVDLFPAAQWSAGIELLVKSLNAIGRADK